ncbi:hypothetical protein ACIP5Z_07170 [Rothia terrae]|nr:hypothetical protein [Rothia terrae]MDT0189565.1 hypothetical protein [Rothia terrae]
MKTSRVLSAALATCALSAAAMAPASAAPAASPYIVGGSQATSE